MVSTSFISTILSIAPLLACIISAPTGGSSASAAADNEDVDLSKRGSYGGGGFYGAKSNDYRNYHAHPDAWNRGNNNAGSGYSSGGTGSYGGHGWHNGHGGHNGYFQGSGGAGSYGGHNGYVPGSGGTGSYGGSAGSWKW